eukprot:CAMPEP_0118921642 /NCGR_PEP_ID=MMETSP1169-20130426/854_1 /TAXON_ID=36882 /ORGANISM="Pyramimonas obovata, Strain CCMP722" /LENGTH=89 /DNA_ID=CAMNT_0006862399 /DNA_START=133 /DNA_END=402 /DNA_ORIENTATION=+
MTVKMRMGTGCDYDCGCCLAPCRAVAALGRFFKKMCSGGASKAPEQVQSAPGIPATQSQAQLLQTSASEASLNEIATSSANEQPPSNVV